MYLYFGLNFNDLEEFCQLVDKENERYEVNDLVFIDITDGIFVRTFIAELTLFTERFVIISLDNKFYEFRPLSLVTLKSFKDCDKEIRVKLFDAVSDVNIRDNLVKLEDDTKSKKEEPRITNKLEKQWNWDCKPLNMSKEETKMTKIKDIKLNGPATILFTTDGKKVIVKCRPGDNYDPEKGILMVLCKYIHNSITHHNNWTEIFDTPYSDEIDVEKVIAMSIVKNHFYKIDKDWHYNYVLKYMYNAVNLQTEDRVKALKALDYSVERIARCLGITKGLVKDILKPENKTVWETAKESLLSYLDGLKKATNSLNKVPDNKPCNTEEKDVITDQNIIDLFNKGYSINKISKELGLSEYFVKKYLDTYTNPKTEKKADKILKKAVKNSKKEKKPRGGYHKRLTEIAFPSYLTKEESEDILEKTKVKYEGKYKYMSELQKYFDRECKHFAINKFYGNGYSAFELGQMLGVSVATIMRMRNNPI